VLPDLAGGEGLITGLANVLVHLAPLYLMCDPRDVRVVPEVRSPFTGAPTIYLYESIPGGVGFAERLFALRQELLQAAAGLIADCACPDGCPSCVGPPIELGAGGKAAVLVPLARLGARASGTSQEQGGSRRGETPALPRTVDPR
jgi:DEAD/DEAH box helicase domain-containing protein